jgi:hypothetical protein
MFNSELTVSRSRVLLEKQIFAQLVKKFPTFVEPEHILLVHNWPPY